MGIGARDRFPRKRAAGRVTGLVPRAYLGRLAAELGVIVAGILLALAADALMERRADRAREVELLRTLAADLSESAQDLRDDSDFAGERSATIRAYLALRDQQSPALTRDEATEILRAANITASYAPILRAYEALIASGSLGLIRNDDILFGLADVKRRTEEYLDYRAQTTNLWLFTLMPVWLEEVESADAEGLAKAIRSTQFRAAMGQRMMFLRFTGERGGALADRMNDLASGIEAELASRR